ncbi:MAG: amidohydrolase family protein [Gemmatimonadales bacterium]|nr:amidohydrolase family protein [Gemmatimonadales bacterium]NIN12424.1 amidohydrolase family protein [Gemmatimonadales bacterium]NIN50800.1 amidohydrolase family protein [Gemmatimonadales bacterium]NIP08264.1 amidohydrolase family protein [Gemmatimonadales bacterium]NIR00788.1 amidohydrolase family protein [Gemmatimonadales bacterium]
MSSAERRGVTDLHVHIQPWHQLKPAVAEAMRRGKEEHWERLIAMMDDPKALLDILDAAGIWRVGLVNYPSPDLMGFTDETNQFAAQYAAAAPDRLLPYGGVHPRFTNDPEGQVEGLLQLGIRCLKIHPPHQLFPANAYTMGLEALGRIYRRCEERGLPVMIHTGTSIFPGARCKYGRPMELDDVALDFPDLVIIMAHGGRPLWMDEAFFIMRRHRNVYLEISGIPPSKLLEYFPRLHEITDRVLWGTDWPSPGVRDLRLNLEEFLALPLSDEGKDRITRTTPLELFPQR